MVNNHSSAGIGEVVLRPLIPGSPMVRDLTGTAQLGARCSKIGYPRNTPEVGKA